MGNRDHRRWIDLGPDPVPHRKDRAVIRVDELGVTLLVIRTLRGVLAWENACPHRGRTLEDGKVALGYITCEGHGWRFRLDTGACVGPGRAYLRSWRVAVSDGRLLLRMPRLSHGDV